MSLDVPGPVRLAGEGLVLRSWREEDLAEMVVLCDDPAIALRTPLPSPFTAQSASERLARARTGEPLLLAITHDGGEPLGEVMLSAAGTLGYLVGAEHRGQGLAARALRVLVRHAADRGLTALHLEIEPDNAASAAVARQAGFRLARPAAEVVVDKGRRVVLDGWERTAP